MGLEKKIEEESFRENLLRGFSHSLASQGYSKAYSKRVIIDIKGFIVFCGFEDIMNLNPEVIRQYVEYFEDSKKGVFAIRKSVFDICKIFGSLMLFYNYLWLTGQVEVNPFEHI